MRRNCLDLTLYLVTDMSIEDSFNRVRKAVEGGVTAVQLREKHAITRSVITIGQQLLALLRPLGVPLIINDRADIAHAVSADGVHLGQSDLSVRAARAILGDRAVIGLSVETIDQVIKAQDEEIDYLAISPLFQTSSKADCAHPWGLKELEKVCHLSRHPVIAIGGINETNVESVISKGVAGVAVMSAILNSPSPCHAAREIKKKINQFQE